MSETKLTTLAHLRAGLEQTKAYVDEKDLALSNRIDAVVEDIEGIVATGGEANILEGVKVNGQALTITDKMVENVWFIMPLDSNLHRLGNSVNTLHQIDVGRSVMATNITVMLFGIIGNQFLHRAVACVAVK